MSEDSSTNDKRRSSSKSGIPRILWISDYKRGKRWADTIDNILDDYFELLEEMRRAAKEKKLSRLKIIRILDHVHTIFEMRCEIEDQLRMWSEQESRRLFQSLMRKG